VEGQVMDIDLKNTLFPYIDAWNNPDAPDGAWQAMMESGVESYNQEHNTDYDFCDIMGEYIDYRMELERKNEK
jgi:hypothetical protein